MARRRAVERRPQRPAAEPLATPRLHRRAAGDHRPHGEGGEALGQQHALEVVVVVVVVLHKLGDEEGII